MSPDLIEPHINLAQGAYVYKIKCLMHIEEEKIEIFNGILIADSFSDATQQLFDNYDDLYEICSLKQITQGNIIDTTDIPEAEAIFNKIEKDYIW